MKVLYNMRGPLTSLKTELIIFVNRMWAANHKRLTSNLVNALYESKAMYIYNSSSQTTSNDAAVK